MKRVAVIASVVALFACAAFAQTEPDYSAWTSILQKYYDPAKGMDYAGLKAHDAATIQNLRQQLAKVNVSALNRKQQQAYWMNLYNINVIGTIVESYPVKSIRDISTDLFKINVFKTDRVPYGNGKISLNDIENKQIREGFKDPRIHFAINCAAKSCPPLCTEAFVGDRLDSQLDDQARDFLNGPLGVRYGKKGDKLVMHVTKIMSGGLWFGKDFEQWGGGKAPFIRKYVPADKQKVIDDARGNIDFDYDDYNWELNDWKR
jgi:hypothetical protein